MSRNIKYIILTIIMFCFFSCEDTDICDNASSTPRLIVEFKDKSDESKSKNLENLFIDRKDSDGTTKTKLISSSNVSKASIPLSLGSKSTTIYIYTKDQGTKSEITISYTPTQEYISKACGFREIYNDLSAKLISSDFISYIKNTNSINDENTSHITIYY